MKSIETLENERYALASKIAHRTHLAIRGAIMAGYDGVDISKEPPFRLSPEKIGIKSIEPWHDDDKPDGDNGYRTYRYSWDWFSDDELNAICSADTLSEATEQIQ